MKFRTPAKKRRLRRFLWLLLILELALIALCAAAGFRGTGIVWSMEDISSPDRETISLPAGVYTLRVDYHAEEDPQGTFGVSSKDHAYYSLLSNPVPFRRGVSQGNCQFYLLNRIDDLKVELNASGSVRVIGAEIIRGKESGMTALFLALTACLCLDGALWFLHRCKRHPLEREQKIAASAVAVLTLAASLPALVDYHCMGTELLYHFMRIEALADNIRRGALTARISGLWLAGHGYADSLFSGNLFLLLPALLRVLGFSMDFSYRVFLLAVNFVTAQAAYVSFSKCLKNRLAGVLGCALYTLAPYRLDSLYNRSAAGEFTAMIFLPLLVWGLYRIYTRDPEAKKSAWDWILPAAAFTGLIQSHLVSLAAAGGFTALLCLLLWKKTFRRKTFCTLCKAAGMTALLNAWFLVPLLDLASADQYLYAANAGMLIQSRGMYPAHLFYTLQEAGSSYDFGANGMIGTEPAGPGAALLLCAGLWLYVRAKRRPAELSAEERTLRRAGDISFCFWALALFIGTRCFPWDLLSVHCRPLAVLAGFLQTPVAVMPASTACGVFTACVMGRFALEKDLLTVVSGKGMLALVVSAALLFGCYQTNTVLLEKSGIVRLYSVENMGTMGVLGGEYLPAGTNMEHMAYHDPVPGAGAAVERYQRDGLEALADVSSETPSYVEFPFLYYKGYRAEMLDTGEELSVVKGDNGDVRLILPENLHGRVRVWYAGMPYWHIAELVSAAAGILLAAALAAGRRGRKS